MIAAALLSIALFGGAQSLGATDYGQYEIVGGSIRDFSAADAARLEVSRAGKRWATVTVELRAVRPGSMFRRARVASERRLLAVDCNTGRASVQQLFGYARPGLAGPMTERITAHFFGEAENFPSVGSFEHADAERTRGLRQVVGNFLALVCGPSERR